MLTEIIVVGFIAIALIIVWNHFALKKWQMRLEQSRIVSERHGGTSNPEGFDLQSILTNPAVQQMIAGFLKPKE